MHKTFPKANENKQKSFILARIVPDTDLTIRLRIGATLYPAFPKFGQLQPIPGKFIDRKIAGLNFGRWAGGNF